MSAKTSINFAHHAGYTSLAFSRDGSRIYTGGSDALVRIWRTDKGTDQEPDVALDAHDPVTSVAAGNDFWLSGSVDSDVRRYQKASTEFEGLITSAPGVAIYCIAVDPSSSQVAVSSEETTVKVVDLRDTTKVKLLKGHTKAVRKVTWHPNGSLLTSSGADGKIIVWNVSGDEPSQVETIDGIIPVASGLDTPEFSHDCSVIWHTSGQYFFAATRAHEIITVSRSDWKTNSTFSDEAAAGAVTAMALSTNGVYLATASKSGLCIWSTQNRRMLYKYQGALSAPIAQLAWSPSVNLLAWTGTDGVLTRWVDPIPPDGISPVKPITASVAAPLPAAAKRKGTPTLFDFDAEEGPASGAKPKDVDMALDGLDGDDAEGNEIDLEAGLDDWVVDDLGGGLDDDPEEKRWGGKGGVREMVSVTKAQPAFQPGATPMENKKRYLAYNMIGMIEVTDQDTHHVVNVEFHDRSARKGYHFTDHFKYDLAALGERGAVYACQPEAEHTAHVMYKPYGNWTSQSEWTYDLPKGTRVLGVAAGGAPPTRSLRERSDADIQGNGNVVIATSDHELIFITGGGVERYVMSMQGDFVTMVAGPEWVFVVEREGTTTMDGSQNLTGRLIKFEDYCLLQRDILPVPKGHTLKWIGVTEEGAPAIYDSAGVLHALPRFRIPFSATWTRLLNTSTLERREGKDESYWPVGVSGETFMCLILKGREEYPGFPRPLIQELPLRLPFKRIYPSGTPSEEQLARENMFLDILRDSLDDELTTDEISRRELELDKGIIQLIQAACKNDQLARAIDLAKLLHHTASFDMAIKLAGFYHLIGLQEKFEALKEDREDVDRLDTARDKRRERALDFAAVPAPRQPVLDVEPPRPKLFQNFDPPPAVSRPGLQRATPASVYRPPTGTSRDLGFRERSAPQDEFHSTAATRDWEMDPTPDTPKRKRSEGIGSDAENGAKRRATEEQRVARSAVDRSKGNPFARKANPFAKSTEANKESRNGDSFLGKVASLDLEKSKKPALGKTKSGNEEKKQVPKQTKLAFGKKTGRDNLTDDSQMTEEATETQESQGTENIGVTLVISTQSTQIEVDQTQARPHVEDDDPIVDVQDEEMDDDEEPIPWPASPEREPVALSNEAEA